MEKNEVKKLVVGEGITSLERAFQEWKNLKEIVLPDSIYFIEEGAFLSCRLNSVDWKGLLYNLNEKGTLTVSGEGDYLEGTFSIYRFWNETSIKKINMDVRLSGIANFQLIQNLEKVIISGSVDCIGGTAFSRCRNLTEVSLPDGVTKIDFVAFHECENLTKINFPEGLTFIGYHAFGGCKSLKNISFPNTLNVIRDNAFEGSGLTSVEIPGSVSEISYSTFYNCTDLETVVLKDGIQSIDEVAFADCGLKDITIPASVTEIGLGAIGYHVDKEKYYDFYRDHEYNKDPSPEIYLFKQESLPTIHCYADTAAHKYTVDNGIPFELITTSTDPGTTPGSNPGTGSGTIPGTTQETGTTPGAETTTPVTLSAQQIAREVSNIQNAQAGTSLTVSMGNATVVPKEMLEAAKGKDVTMVLQMNGYTWSINGKDIIGTAFIDINLQVIRNTTAIPADRLKKTAGDNPAEQVSLVYSGEFGFTARLTLNVGSKYAGKSANLYYYNNKGELEFQNASVISADGRVTLKFNHASDYAIVITEAISPKTGQEDIGTAVLVVLLLLSVAGVAGFYRRRRNSF